MAHMTSAIRKLLDEYINDIPDGLLEQFVRAPLTQPGDVDRAFDFGSQDFYLVYTGDSDDESTPGWKMFELRANMTSKNQAVNFLAHNSKKYEQNQRRFAFIMLSGHAMIGMAAQHVRMALKACPVWEAALINKVRVEYQSHVVWGPHPDHPQSRVPWPGPGMLPNQMYDYNQVPFPGFNVDGTKVPKPGKQGKKEAAGGKK